VVSPASVANAGAAVASGEIKITRDQGRFGTKGADAGATIGNTEDPEDLRAVP